MANNKNKNGKKNVGKIRFENERSALITKIENTTGGWKFFGYMYNTAMFRTLLLELMMIIFALPAVVIIFLASSKILGLSQNLPYSATFGLGIMPWFGLGHTCRYGRVVGWFRGYSRRLLDGQTASL